MPNDSENIHQKIYLEFENLQKRAEAMTAINELRKEKPEIFEGLQSIKVDPNPERSEQGLELSFDNLTDNRGQIIVELLHQKGIELNKKDGKEEMPYDIAA